MAKNQKLKTIHIFTSRYYKWIKETYNDYIKNNMRQEYIHQEVVPDEPSIIIEAINENKQSEKNN